MSTYSHDYSGRPQRFETRSVSQVLAARRPPEVILEHFLDAGTTLNVLVEDEINHFLFVLLLAASIACGFDFGIYRSTGPRRVFLIAGAGHFDFDGFRLKLVCDMPQFADAQALLEKNLQIYHQGLEQDPPIDLGHSVTQEAMRRSMPDKVDVVVVDWVPHFTRPKKARLEPITPYQWFKDLNAESVSVVAFDRLRSSDRHGNTETTNAFRAYLTIDSNAPSQFGDGFQIERWRVTDADYAPRKSSFWHTNLGGELEYGFSLIDVDDVDKPALTRKTEREIKLEILLAANMPQKDIAEELQVHKSTITRMKQRLKEEADAAAKIAARDPRSPQNSWDNVMPLGKHLRAIRKESAPGDESVIA